jgi:hypothetical protein
VHKSLGISIERGSLGEQFPFAPEAGLIKKEWVIAAYYQISSGGYFFFPTFFALFLGLALAFLTVLQPQFLHIFGSPLLFFACKIGRQVKSSYQLYINRLQRSNQLNFLRQIEVSTTNRRF